MNENSPWRSIGQGIQYSLLGAFLVVAAWLLIVPPKDQLDESAESKKEGRTVIRYWEKWTGNEASQMKQIVDEYNDTVGKTQRIYVQYLSVSNVDRKTLTATAGGVPPDVAGLWDSQVAQFSALDALEPLDEMAAAKGITRDYYKPVYWDACTYEGKLYALISTPACVALHYNRRIFEENAGKLRAAGCDPTRPPRTIEELDRYASAFDDLVRDKKGNVIKINRAGYLPLEPGWFLGFTPYWFGNSIYDEQNRRFMLEDPAVLKAFEWVRSYSLKLGKNSMTEFKQGMSGHDSPQNPFMIGSVVMVQQGPWEANFIENRAPHMDRWHMLPDDWTGMPESGDKRRLMDESNLRYKQMLDDVASGKLTREQRRQYYEWAAASPAFDGRPNVTYAGFDILCIPRGSKHKKEAFDFIAYVNRQDVMEKLNKLHCKNSPLAKVSDDFIRTHPNPYIEVFEEIAQESQRERIAEDFPIWPEVGDELNYAMQKVYLLEQEPAAALHEAQLRLQSKLDHYFKLQAIRRQQERPEGGR